MDVTALTDHQRLAVLMNGVGGRVILEAVIAHQSHVVVEFLRRGVLSAVELALDRPQIHGILDDLIVVL